MIPVLFRVEQVQQPNWWQVIPTIILAIATIYLGYKATSIAHRQADTAVNKLKFDLYNKRYKLYYDFVSIFEAVIFPEDWNMWKKLFNKYKRATHEIKFLMPKETYKYFDELDDKLYEHSYTLQRENEIYSEKTKEDIENDIFTDAEREKLATEQTTLATSRTFILTQFKTLSDTFKTVLDFTEVL